ncbi:MAG: hypothetical protein ACRBDL_07270 [Alphaproteobacteria bacterium]
MNIAQAREAQRPFTVYLNENPFASSQDVSPCYPVMARFEHPDPNITHVRMRYPLNWFMYRVYPVGEDVNITIHEDFMKQGKVSFSDFIAEDAAGNQYDKITLTFLPIPEEEYEDLCWEYLNS